MPLSNGEIKQSLQSTQSHCPCRQRDEEKRRKREERSPAKRLTKFYRELRGRDREDQDLKHRRSFTTEAPGGYNIGYDYSPNAASDLTNGFGDMDIDGRSDAYNRKPSINSSNGSSYNLAVEQDPVIAPPPVEAVHPALFIHTTKLPIMDVSLDYALTHFRTHTISPWTNPVEWVSTESNYVKAIIHKLAMLNGGDEIAQDRTIPQVMIYSVNFELTQF